jgi:hypothetical protein
LTDLHGTGGGVRHAPAAAMSQTHRMAFGQSPGPSASGRQINELLELLQRAGHTDFRDARGPMGFTQRQAAGKFTVQEATEYIEQLQAAEYDGDGGAVARPTPPLKLSAAEQALRAYPDQQLAAELQRRGWIVVEP